MKPKSQFGLRRWLDVRCAEHVNEQHPVRIFLFCLPRKVERFLCNLRRFPGLVRPINADGPLGVLSPGHPGPRKPPRSGAKG